MKLKWKFPKTSIDWSQLHTDVNGTLQSVAFSKFVSRTGTLDLYILYPKTQRKAGDAEYGSRSQENSAVLNLVLNDCGLTVS